MTGRPAGSLAFVAVVLGAVLFFLFDSVALDVIGAPLLVAGAVGEIVVGVLDLRSRD